MEYIKEGFTLPVPINLLPTSVAIADFVCKIKNLMRPKELDRNVSISHSNMAVVEEPGNNYELKSQASFNPIDRENRNHHMNQNGILKRTVRIHF